MLVVAYHKATALHDTDGIQYGFLPDARAVTRRPDWAVGLYTIMVEIPDSAVSVEGDEVRFNPADITDQCLVGRIV